MIEEVGELYFDENDLYVFSRHHHYNMIFNHIIQESGNQYKEQVYNQNGIEDILNEGISIPAENGKTPFLPITEMAEAIAVVLTTSGHETKEYIIAAGTAVAFAEIADLISEITGTTVAYNQTNIQSYVAQLVQQGVPDDDAAYLSRFSESIARGEFETNKSDLKHLLGRSPISLKDFLKSIYGN